MRVLRGRRRMHEPGASDCRRLWEARFPGQRIRHRLPSEAIGPRAVRHSKFPAPTARVPLWLNALASCGMLMYYGLCYSAISVPDLQHLPGLVHRT
eukprot:scaffold4854_cov131-Isochrysis_galbana.AAC.11